MKLFFSLFFLLMSTFGALGQMTISGNITDSISGEPLPFVKVYAKTNQRYTETDTLGKFELTITDPIDTLILRDVFYKEKRVPINAETSFPIAIHLVENSVSFEEVRVIAGENPAFKILRKVWENEKHNNPVKLDAYQCEVYNKMQFDLTNLSDKFEDRKLIKKMNFILDYVDTTNGEKNLPVLLSETVSEMYYKGSPRDKKEIIKATRIVGIENLKLDQFTGEMHQSINIYSRSINIFNRGFVSPIAPGAKAFYKHYLQDDDTLSGQILHHITFIPRRKGTAVFEGEVWIDPISYAITRFKAVIPNDVNLNYISDFTIDQQFTKTDAEHYFLTDEHIAASFALMNQKENRSMAGVKIQKDVTRSNFKVGEVHPASFYASAVVIEDDANNRPESFWNKERKRELSNQQEGVVQMIDSLKQNKHFKLLDKFTHFMFTGYWKVGYIELGNLYSLYNRNVAEGHRVQLSVRTSKAFSKTLRISAFGAYGFKDREFKYGTSVKWCPETPNYQSLEFSFKKKIEQIGLGRTQFDFGKSLAMLLANGPVDKLTMVKNFGINYERDWDYNLRTISSVFWNNYTPLGKLKYVAPNDGTSKKTRDLTFFEIKNTIMFTRDEKFLEGRFRRISLGSKYPILALTHTLGIKNVLKSAYNYQKLAFSISQNVRLGAFGKIKYALYGGKVFGKVPFPLLHIHNGSETFYLQKHSFNLLNYYELISDQWLGINFEHHLQGAIFDRIPLVNKLKLRLVYTAKAVMGSYAANKHAQLQLPTFSYTLNSGVPYTEFSIGIENILKVIRIDAVWRGTYRGHLNSSGKKIGNFGVRIMFATAL